MKDLCNSTLKTKLTMLRIEKLTLKSWTLWMRGFGKSWKDVRERNFMVYHPSWGYFAAEYGLTMIPVEVEGKEPSARDLAKLVDLAKGKEGQSYLCPDSVQPEECGSRS